MVGGGFLGVADGVFRIAGFVVDHSGGWVS
jgi:hypothetical protein